MMHSGCPVPLLTCCCCRARWTALPPHMALFLFALCNWREGHSQQQSVGIAHPRSQPHLHTSQWREQNSRCTAFAESREAVGV
eukprot:1141191-Pelagomonas_calceolata.AAC.5